MRVRRCSAASTSTRLRAQRPRSVGERVAARARASGRRRRRRAKNSRGRPMRSPTRRRRAPATSSAAGSGQRGRRRAGRGRRSRSSSERGVGRTLRPNGPIWSSERRERDQAVARDPAVGRLQADDAAQRRRLADRAARVGAERRAGTQSAPRPRPRCRRTSRPARARCPTGCASGRRREFSVDEPIANSSRLVEPTTTETRLGRASPARSAS